MGVRLPGVVSALRRSVSLTKKSGPRNSDVPKGFFAVYVGTHMKTFVVPVSYLNQPLFQDLLSRAEEEFGFDHPMGGLTIPCDEDLFVSLTSQLQ